jgi:hypothetical protein
MLYIFGDSFSTPHEHKSEVIGPNGIVSFLPLEKNWTSIVSEELTGSRNHVNESVLGCANEFIFHKLTERESSFKSGDYVIVQLTSYYREWFFEDKPHMGNYISAKFEPGVHASKEVTEALEMYKKYLYSDHRLIIHYIAMRDAIILRTKLLAEINVRFLIIPGFHNIRGVEGTMFDASNTEFDCKETADAFYNKTSDNRYNHFSENNHKILANKIINFFKNGNTVDLTAGFETSIYNKDNF